MRKSRAAKNRKVRTNGLVAGRRFVNRKVFNVVMDDAGYTAVVELNHELWRVVKPKHAKSWSPLSLV